jgi:hypothetical protein
MADENARQAPCRPTVIVDSPSEVRSQIIEQHRVLRDLLRRALDATTATLQHAPGAPSLTEVVRELRTRFVGHLAFEERALVPVLAETDGWGAQRVAELLAEHRQQRAELATLIQGAESGWEAERLALLTRSLVADLLRDMEEEERGCLSADLLRDDVVSVDQATD